MPIPIPASTIRKISNGSRGTDETVSYMRKMIKSGSLDPRVRNLSVALTYNIPKNIDKIEKLFNFVQSHMAYIRDNYFVETLQTPRFMSDSFHYAGCAFGDCDDHTIFLGSLLISIGFPVKIVVIKANPNSSGYDHVYLKTFINGLYIPLDATNKTKSAGWEPYYYSKKEYFV